MQLVWMVSVSSVNSITSIPNIFCFHFLLTNPRPNGFSVLIIGLILLWGRRIFKTGLYFNRGSFHCLIYIISNRPEPSLNSPFTKQHSVLEPRMFFRFISSGTVHNPALVQNSPLAEAVAEKSLWSPRLSKAQLLTYFLHYWGTSVNELIARGHNFQLRHS